MSFWFIGILFIKFLFSSELTAKLGFKTPVKQINTLEELVNSNIKLIIINSFPLNEPMRGLNLKIYDKAFKYGAIVRIPEFYGEDKWVEEVAAGESAILLFEVPIHIMITNALKKLRENCRFRYLPEDYGQKFSLTIASSKRLDVKFRHKLNFR